LGKIFGLKRDEVTGDWRKLQSEELHSLYPSPSIIRIIRSKGNEIGTTCRTHREKMTVYSVVVGKSEGKRQLG
jgi:hypothetical protein